MSFGKVRRMVLPAHHERRTVYLSSLMVSWKRGIEKFGKGKASVRRPINHSTCPRRTLGMGSLCYFLAKDVDNGTG